MSCLAAKKVQGRIRKSRAKRLQEDISDEAESFKSYRPVLQSNPHRIMTAHTKLNDVT